MPLTTSPLPAYQHPTTVVLVDDSRSFLDSLALSLDQDVTYRTFDDPRKAIDWLREVYRHIDHDVPHSLNRQDARQIINKVMNKQRFTMPSLLIVDYSMSQMNGLALCEAIRGLPCKRILLTGHSGEEIATEGLNRKLIDGCIKKHDPEILRQLVSSTTTMQRQFFIELAGREFPDQADFLFDPAIMTLVAQLYNNNHFCEHYVFSTPNGILFIDFKGKPSLMVIETQGSLIAQSEQVQKSGGPEEFVIALKELQIIPFYFKRDGIYTERIGRDWRKYALPAEICYGRQKYYWAIFDLPADYFPMPIYGYDDFIRDFDSGLIH